MGLGFARVIGAHLAIPEVCIHLTWTHVERIDEEASAFHVCVTLLPLPYRTLDDDVCHVCMAPWEDADLEGSATTREENCSECLSCFLCPLCRVHTGAGEPRCLFCLEQSDVAYIAAHSTEWQLMRYRLLAVEVDWY